MTIKSLLTGAVILAGLVAVICLLVKRKQDREPIIRVSIDDPGMEPYDSESVPQTGAMATPSNRESIVTATKGWEN